MRFRTRLLLALGAVAVVPLVLFAYGVRREVFGRLAAQDAERIAALVQRIERDMAGEGRAVAARLATLVEALRDDNRFRRAAVADAVGDRAYLLDYAGGALRLTGLDMLQVQDAQGRIVSSGHFRNEFDRLDPDLPALLARADADVALAATRTAAGGFVALVRVDSVRLGGRAFTVVGGVSVTRRLLDRLDPGDRLAVHVLTAHDTLRAEGAVAPATLDSIVWERSVTFIGPDPADPARRETARIVVVQTASPLAAIQRRLGAWLLAAVAGTALAATLAAVWAAARISRPLAQLAERTAAVDLDRLDVDFTTTRPDEVGALSRLLAAMTNRLRESVRRLREAERRATVGDLARQVNHDIKNGLTPIRNVFRHLAEVARDQPEHVGDVFTERQGTVESSIGYLEDLASNYARLSPGLRHADCDVNAVLRRVVEEAGVGAPAVAFELSLDAGPLRIRTDPLILRRILENLTGNAVESLDGAGGRVTVATRVAGSAGDERVTIAVSDTGPGMTEAELERAFDDFYTTKASGTGLGLSIVRRLVADLGGTLRVQTGPGEGATFEVELPSTVSHGPASSA